MSEGEAGVVGESSSQIAKLSRVLREKEKEMEEYRHMLLDLSGDLSKVSVIVLALH